MADEGGEADVVYAIKKAIQKLYSEEVNNGFIGNSNGTHRQQNTFRFKDGTDIEVGAE